MGEDIGPLGGVFRVTEGLQAEFGDEPRARHPARRVRHRRHRDRPRHARLPPGRARSSSTASSSRLQPDHLAAREADQPRTRARCTLPVVIRIPYGGHIGAVEHHQESPEAYFAHTAGPPRGQPVDPARRLLDDPGGDRVERPGDLLRAEEPLLAEGRGRPRRRGRADCTPAASSAPAPRSPSSGTARWSRRLLQAADIAAAEGTSCRGRRPALAVADRLRAAPRVGAQDRPPGRRAGGARLRQRRLARSPRPSPSGRSTRSRRRCCGSAGSTSRSRRRSSRHVYLPDADRILEAVDRALAY